MEEVALVSEYICRLAEIDATSLPLVGGKAANLGELARAQFPVPRAFCVTTRAHERLVE